MKEASQVHQIHGHDADLPASVDGSVYKTYVGTGVDFNTLYVNDTRATMARTKNYVYDPRFPAAHTNYMHTASGGVTNLIYNASDLDATSLNGLLNAQIRGDLDAQVYVWDNQVDYTSIYLANKNPNQLGSVYCN